MDDIAGGPGGGPQSVDHRHVAAFRYETDVLAVRLVGDLQAQGAGDGPDLVLGHLAQGEAQEVELVAGRGEQEIALVAAGVAGAGEAGRTASGDPAAVVTGGKGAGAEVPRHVQQVAELHRLVAPDAGHRRLAPGVGVGEILDHRGAEAGFVVEHEVRDAEGGGGGAGVEDVLSGAAGALPRTGGAVVVELKGDPDDIVARVLEQGGDHGGIDAARHGRDHPRPGREADSGPRRADRVIHEFHCGHGRLCSTGRPAAPRRCAIAARARR